MPPKRRPLHQADRPWRDHWKLPDNSEASKRINFLRKVRAVLNKLTPTSYEWSKRKLVTWQLFDSPVLKEVISIIFEKCLKEQLYCPIYVALCRDLSYTEMYLKKTKKSEIRTELLRQAKDMFNTRNMDDYVAAKTAEIGRAEGDANKHRIRMEIVDTLHKFRARRMANFKLMGHLFANKICGIGSMIGSLDDLLKSVTRKPTNQALANYRADDFAIEGAIAMLTIAGKALEELQPQQFPMDKTFATLKEAMPIVHSTRIKYLIINLFELRARNWIPRITPDLPWSLKKTETTEEEPKQDERREGEASEPAGKIVVPSITTTTTTSTRPSSAPQSRDQSTTSKRSSSEEGKGKSPTTTLPTSVSADDLELLEECTCIICAELFDSAEHTPRFLECGHSFCHTCIYKWRTATCDQRTGRVTKIIKCPTCTQVHELPDGKVLMANYSLIAIADKLRKSQERRREAPVEEAEERVVCRACEQKHPSTDIRVCMRSSCETFNQLLCPACVVNGKHALHVATVEEAANLNKIRSGLRTNMTELFSLIGEERQNIKARVLLKIEQRLEAIMPKMDDATARRLAAQLDGIASEQEALFFKGTLDDLVRSHRSEFGLVEKGFEAASKAAARGAQPDQETQPIVADVIDLTKTSPLNTSSSEIEE